MSTFNVLEDVENVVPKNHKVKRVHDPLPSKVDVGEKKACENRGILKELSNGVWQEAKRLKLSCEEDVRKVIRLDESPKEICEPLAIVNEVAKCDNGSDAELEFTSSDNEENAEKPVAFFSQSLLSMADYKSDIWHYLRETELSHPSPRPNYMLKQTNLTWHSRSVLVDWLASVADSYKMCNETLHLSVNYIDRFLSHISVVKGKFQLVGAAAMLLAGKIEEIYPIEVREWVYLTGDSFTSRQVKKMEQTVVKTLKFKMQPPTTCTFIEHFCQEHQLDTETMHLAMYISELVLLEGKDYLKYLPSKLAAASIALARHTLSKGNPWPKKFKEHCGYSIRQLSPVVQRQQRTLIDSPHKEHQEIQKKYKSERYHKVAMLKPRKLSLVNFEGED